MVDVYRFVGGWAHAVNGNHLIMDSWFNSQTNGYMINEVHNLSFCIIELSICVFIHLLVLWRRESTRRWDELVYVDYNWVHSWDHHIQAWLMTISLRMMCDHIHLPLTETFWKLIEFMLYSNDLSGKSAPSKLRSRRRLSCWNELIVKALTNILMLDEKNSRQTKSYKTNCSHFKETF